MNYKELKEKLTEGIDIGNKMILEFSLVNFRGKVENYSKRIDDIEKLLAEDDSVKISEYARCINCQSWNTYMCNGCTRKETIEEKNDKIEKRS